MPTPVYLHNFTTDNGITFNDPSGFEAFNQTYPEAGTILNGATALNAHQGYTANTASTFHYTIDDLSDPTGKIDRWDDNAGGNWINAGTRNNLFVEIQAQGAEFANIDHLGGCVFYDDGGNGQIFVAISNQTSGTAEDNGIAIYDGVTLALLSALILDASDTFEFGSMGFHNNELYFASFYGQGVRVYDFPPVPGQFRTISFSGVSYPYGVQGISVDSDGIHLNDRQARYYRYSLTGQYEIAFQQDTGDAIYGDPQDLEVRNGDIRILYDSSGSNVIGYTKPVATNLTQTSEGITTDDPGGIIINDTSINTNPSELMPVDFTLIMRMRANTFFSDNNHFFNNLRNQTHWVAWFDVNGFIRYQPRSGNQIVSDVALNNTDFYDIAIRWSISGGTFDSALTSLFVDGQKQIDTIAGGVTPAQQLRIYGLGGIGGVSNSANDSDLTIEQAAIFYEALTDQEVEDWEWPAVGKPVLTALYSDVSASVGDSYGPVDYTSNWAGADSYNLSNLPDGIDGSDPTSVQGTFTRVGNTTAAVDASNEFGTTGSNQFTFYIEGLEMGVFETPIQQVANGSPFDLRKADGHNIFSDGFAHNFIGVRFYDDPEGTNEVAITGSADVKIETYEAPLDSISSEGITGQRWSFAGNPIAGTIEFTGGNTAHYFRVFARQNKT